MRRRSQLGADGGMRGCPSGQISPANQDVLVPDLGETKTPIRIIATGACPQICTLVGVNAQGPHLVSALRGPWEAAGTTIN
jgi:hypothetical protein